MQYVCDAPNGKTWFRIETEGEAVHESRLMGHTVEKYFRREREKAVQSWHPKRPNAIERDIGLEAHVQREMPLFLTLRDGEGNALTTAMLPRCGALQRRLLIIFQYWFARRSVGDPPNVVDGLDLGDANAVRERGNRVQIRFGERGSSGVDSYPGGVVPESAGDVVACGRLVFRRDRVLEVEDHRVRACVEDLAEQFLAVPGSEQIATIHYNTPFALSAATRSGSSPSDSE